MKGALTLSSVQCIIVYMEALTKLLCCQCKAYTSDFAFIFTVDSTIHVTSRAAFSPS